jgi:hypothetical protein
MQTTTTTVETFTALPMTPDDLVSSLTSGVLGMDPDGHFTGDPAVLAWLCAVAERGLP